VLKHHLVFEVQEQTKPNNSAESGAEAEVLASLNKVSFEKIPFQQQNVPGFDIGCYTVD
jgi:hypothetical protein